MTGVKNYDLVTSVEEFKFFADKLIQEGLPFGFDIETGYDGPDKAKAQLHPEEGFVVGFSFTNSLEWARYVPLRHDYNNANLDPAEVAPILWELLQIGLTVSHNICFELRHMSKFFRDYIPGLASFSRGYFPFFSDSMLEAYVVGTYFRVGLKLLTHEVFGHKMIELIELFPEGTKKDVIRFNTLELNPKVIAYACEDSLWCLALHQKHYPLVKDTFVYKEEIQIVPILCDMEDFGVQLDWEFLAKAFIEAKDFLAAQNSEIQFTIEKLLGHPVSINLGSSQQVRKLLYEDLGFTTTRMTKTSKNTADPKLSTDAIALERLAKEQPIVKKIVEWREVKKLIGSYLEKYVRELNYDLETDRAHPSHNQAAVVTGRFSVSEFNYQQLPKYYHYALDDGTEYNLNFRNAVVAPDDYYIAGFDNSQIEIRVMAGEAQEDSLMKAFAAGIDIHAQVAAIVLGIPVEEITEEQRDEVGKLVNLATGYGLGAQAMADRLAISEEEAESILEQYFERVPKLKAFIESSQREGRRDGFVTNRFGRKMTIWDYQSPNRWVRDKGDRASFNYKIQSAGTGDLTKIQMIRADQAIKAAGLSDKIHLVMNVHDELNYYVHNSIDFEQTFVPLIHSAAIFPVAGWPPIEAEWHKGERWGSLTEYVRLSDGKLMEKKAFKAAKKAEAAKSVVSASGGAVVVVLTSMPSNKEFSQFVAAVRSNPGPNSLVLETPKGRLTVSDATSVTPGHFSLKLLGRVEAKFEASGAILESDVVSF